MKRWVDPAQLSTQKARVSSQSRHQIILFRIQRRRSHINQHDQPLFRVAFLCSNQKGKPMAVILQMTYQKKLGLPNFSSHSCSVSLTVEISDVSVAQQETTRLYDLLQAAVDAQIQQVGYMPDATTYGMHDRQPGNSHRPNGNGYQRQQTQNGSDERWNCTDGQRAFISKIVHESRLDKNEVEAIAQQLFGCGVRQCDRLQASALIEELLEKTGKKVRRSQFNGRPR